MIDRLGKYQIVAQIGRGGMGAVYKANDPQLKRVVALKVISENVDESDELRARFFREAQACAQLSHPNIITIYDLGEDGGRLFIVMEYLEGEELRQVISQRRELALENKLALMVQICDGLAYAHQKGIVHRDIKPGNVFVSHNGVAKVLDFGVARIASATDDLTHTGLLMGTLRYMAPEQARGRVDQRSDMFSAGAVFYELIAYHPPLSFDDPMAILEELRSTAEPSRFRPDEAIPEDLGVVIERALRKDPEERFRDMTEMRGALEEVRARLTREAAALRQRLGAQAAESRALHARLVEQVGGEVVREAFPHPGDRAPVVMLEAACREGDDFVARLRQRVELADRLRPEYEQVMESMRLGQWDAAEGAFEHLLEEMPEHVGAQEGVTRARAEVLRAAEIERQRQEAGHAQSLVDEARQRALPAAAQDEAGAWSAAEATRETGLSALAQEEYVAARERFETAAAQYQAAGEAFDRRVRELLQAARRSLEEQELDECLAVAGKVLALVPDEPEATALSLEAKRRAARRAALEARYNAAREALAAGDLQGAIDALTRLVEEEPDHARAHQLLVDARAQLAEEEARARRLLEEARQEAARQEAARQEAARQEAARQEAARREAARQEAARREAARQEAARQEAARQEAARQEAARQEAARQGEIAAALPEREPESADATVFVREAPAELAPPHEQTIAFEVPEPVGVREGRPMEAPTSVSEMAAVEPAAGPAVPRRFRGRVLALAAGGVLAVACVIWLTASFLSDRRLQAEVGQWQSDLSAARQEAVKVEANLLANRLFGEAEAKSGVGQQQAKDGQLALAVATMRAAVALYKEAGLTATVVGEERAKADQARTLMRAAKERAVPDAQPFKEGLALESEGNRRYEELAFPDAAARFGAAAQRFADVVPKPPSPAPDEPTAAEKIRETLRQYAQVFEAKDLALLQRVRPGIRPDELSRYRNIFDQTRSYKVVLKVEAIKVSGDEAEARGRREDVVVTSNGDTRRASDEFRFRLKRANDRWTIDAVK